MTSLHLPLPTFTAILLSDAAKCLNINVQVEPSVNSPHSPKRDLMKTFDDRFLESYSEYDEGEMNAQDDNDYYPQILISDVIMESDDDEPFFNSEPYTDTTGSPVTSEVLSGSRKTSVSTTSTSLIRRLSISRVVNFKLPRRFKFWAAS